MFGCTHRATAPTGTKPSGRRTIARFGRGRRKQRESLGGAAEGLRPEGADEAMIREEERARVREALRRLPDAQARLLLLRHSGLTYRETAGVLEIAPGSVGTLLIRAEAAFIEAFERSGLAASAREPMMRSERLRPRRRIP